MKNLLKYFGYELIKTSEIKKLNKEIERLREEKRILIEAPNSDEAYKIEIGHGISKAISKTIMFGSGMQSPADAPTGFRKK